MDGTARQRRLFWHGMTLVLVGLLMGTVVQSVANPRMGLSAHTGTLMNGVLVVATGALWPRLALSPRLETVTYWLVVDGSWVSCIALFLAAFFGTSGSTPLHGAGHAGLTVGGVALLVGCALASWGLRRQSPR